jgi:Zn finger protein HypA/HybF involved in hydrogenase expression
MGRTYQFECPLCHYTAKVAGGAADGLHCDVQTIICRDCRELFDVTTRIRRKPAPGKFKIDRPEIPPLVVREFFRGATKWESVKPACPVSGSHFVEPWQHPGRCPRCGSFLEPNGFPVRVWD